MIPTAYKCYIFNGTDTYTDISDKVINDVQIPVLVMNPDQSPVLQGIQLETALDYTATGDSTLDDGVYICLEIGTAKKWYGYIESSYYDYGSKTYFYEVFNIFEGLKNVTCYTDLYANITSLGTERTSAIYSGTSAIAWRDIPVKTLIEHIIESSSYSGLTHVVTWSLGTNMTTILENFCVSSLCIKNLGTDYSDEELTSVTVDPDIKVWDLLLELFKMLGLRYYYTAELAITIKGTDTAPAKTDYMADNATYLLGKWINRYSYQVKKVKEKKKFVLKQNILNIEDNIDPEDIHRYFTPLIYGIPYQAIGNITQSGSDVQIDLPQNHLIPASNNTQIRDLKILSVISGDYSLDDGDWDYADANSIKLIDSSIEEVRYLITNLGADVGSIEACYIRHTNGFAYSTGDITLTGHGLTNETIVISDCYDALMNIHIAGTYLWETGTGYPSAAGYYRIQDANTIYIKKFVNLANPTVATNRTNDGFIRITTGSTGTAKYIISITEKTDYNPTGGGNTTIKVITSVHGITAAAGDTLHINNTGLEDYDGNSWTEDNTATNLESGEYRVIDANTLYLYDDGEADLDTAKLKFIFDKYQNYVNLTDGKEEQSINFTDYLVLYQPATSGSYYWASGWQKDWWVIDMESAAYCLLLNLAIYVPWWYYTYNQAYQTITSESINLDDTVTPIMTTARRIIYNVRNHSIDLEQDSV